GGAGEARRLERREGSPRAGRERTRGAPAGGARRSAARHRLQHRRRGRAQRQDRGELPRGLACADHLSRRVDQGFEERRRQGLPRLPAQRQGARLVREAGFHGPGEVRLVDMTPEEWTAVRLSLLVATTATLASLPFGVAVAWLLARRQFWGKSLLDTLVHLPLILPPVVTGYLLLISFGRRAPIGAFLADNFGIVFSFRWTGAALACGVMGFPLLVRAIRLSIEAVDTRLESAAGTLGARP